MAIFAITGKPRHGKTYYLARKVAEFLKRGERVYSNVFINLGTGALKKFNTEIVGDLYKKEDRDNPDKLLFFWRNIHEWNHMEKGNIIVDEMTRYFNPRQWAQLSEDTEIKLQQHGKEDLDIWGTVQHYTRIDVTLRLLVEKFAIVKMVFGNPNNRKSIFPKRCRITFLELEDIDDYYSMIKRPDLNLEIEVQQKGFWITKKYKNIYDTRQQVGRSETMPLVHKTRSCEICGKEVITHV
jgi:hypothetical protein